MKQEFKVIRPFLATAPISGTQKRFGPGDIIVCDIKQPGATLTLEAGEGSFTAFFSVERPVFEACCKWISRGMP